MKWNVGRKKKNRGYACVYIVCTAPWNEGVGEVRVKVDYVVESKGRLTPLVS